MWIPVPPACGWNTVSPAFSACAGVGLAWKAQTANHDIVHLISISLSNL